MHQGDYNPPPPPPPYYHHQHHPQPYHHPPPPPNPPQPPPPQPPPTTFASAPPFSAADYPPYSPNYPSSFPHIPDPTPPPPPPPPPQYHTTPYYPPYDPHHSSPIYPPYDLPQSNPNYLPYDPQLNPPNYPHSNPNPNPSSTSYVPQFDGGAAKYEHGSGYFDENLSGYVSYGSSRSSLGGGYDYKDDGVYAYEGKSEPYGARGTTPSSKKSSDWSGLFDDYGRAISFPKDDKEKKSSSGGGGGYGGSGSSLKVVRAVPKAEDQTDVKSGVQKFRVKLLPESGGQSVMDVLCMVGLDGIRMLDPNTSRTLRIYPLETVTRCDKVDSSTFAFWSKTSVDVEPRRIRLQSNSYTTNTILDTVTAATVQFKEMGGRIRPSESSKALEPSSEKKKGLGDWIYKLKPVNEEKDHWVPDEAVSKCTGCGSDFSAFNRRHHCRNCGDVFCDKCTQGRTPLTSEENAQPVRVCDRCMAEVTHRLSKAKEASTRPVTLQSHEDLAKKLQEEMEKNLRISSGTKSESNSGKRMREVACPTCTVHLQVQVPSSGSETIECGVCQHPFIVSAH
ncbi:hypothetical protein RND81_02G065900 [Saponaria officinalis]|uniref:FYVE-type domain-containing protein n=1 Tax=Saponaria officinalis TaxID=3572 RepID=A0AAW1MQQ5_SAPOF